MGDNPELIAEVILRGTASVESSAA
jgi:hypothetical protein